MRHLLALYSPSRLWRSLCSPSRVWGTVGTRRAGSLTGRICSVWSSRATGERTQSRAWTQWSLAHSVWLQTALSEPAVKVRLDVCVWWWCFFLCVCNCVMSFFYCTCALFDLVITVGTLQWTMGVLTCTDFYQSHWITFQILKVLFTYTLSKVLSQEVLFLFL